jgi:peptide/nickel transport system permease protein
LLTYTYGQIAFLSRQMRAGMLEILPSEYIRMARAKGLPEWKVVFKHALKNAMLPVITLFASAFPLALGSSVIVEKIFAIPGIGWELYQAILRADYPVIVAIFTIVGLLMLVSFLIIDGLYALVDPRLSNRNSG